MAITFIQALAISFCHWFQKATFTPNLTFAGLRPVPASLLVGLILGDVKTALSAGIVIELVYIGTMVVGSITPADVHAAGFFGSAMAVVLAPSLGLEAAIAGGLSLAVAIATPAAAISQIQRAISTTFNERSRAAAERGDLRMQRIWHWVPGQLFYIVFWIPVGVVFLMAMGNETVLGVITSVLEPIAKYIRVVGSVLPAVGIALSLRSIATKHTMPYVIIGFLLSAYLNVPIFGITIVGVCLAFLVVFAKDDKSSGSGNGAEVSGEIIGDIV